MDIVKSKHFYEVKVRYVGHNEIYEFYDQEGNLFPHREEINSLATKISRILARKEIKVRVEVE